MQNQLEFEQRVSLKINFYHPNFAIFFNAMVGSDVGKLGGD